MQKIVLATTSPYRKKAFEMLGIPFETCNSEVDENFSARPKRAYELVQELARRKAEAVAERYEKGLVIGFDSAGQFMNIILEKPKSKTEAYDRLLVMSGKNFQFYTGICFIDAKNGKRYERVSTTDARMRRLTPKEIKRYLKEDPDYKTYALGFDPLGHSSASFVSEVSGSYNNLLRGIPLEVIIEMISMIDEKS